MPPADPTPAPTPRSRRRPRPIGRADHQARVAAAVSSIDRLLARLAADEDQGVARWASKLIAEGDREVSEPRPLT